MKKKALIIGGIVIVLAISVILAITFGTEKSPTGDPPNGYGENLFIAKILEVNDTYLLVEVTDSGNSGISVGAEVDVTTNIENCPDFEVGEYARVVFNGEVMEKDPLALGTVFALSKFDITDTEEGKQITEIKPAE